MKSSPNLAPKHANNSHNNKFDEKIQNLFQDQDYYWNLIQEYGEEYVLNDESGTKNLKQWALYSII